MATSQTWYHVRFEEIKPISVIAVSDRWVTIKGGQRLRRGSSHPFHGTVHPSLSEAMAELQRVADTELATAVRNLEHAQIRVAEAQAFSAKARLQSNTERSEN